MYKLNQISKVFYQQSWFDLISLKKGKKNIVLNKISIDFNKGEFIGIVGDNGSGKSTLLRIIAGIISPDSGNLDLGSLNKNISYISGGERSFFWRLTVFQNLDFFGALYGLDKKNRRKHIERISKKLLITELLDRPFMELSTGNKKKISFARALLHNPKVFLFDELTSSLDIQTKNLFISIVKSIHSRSAEKIFFWVSHDMNEINDLSTKIYKIQNGNIIDFVGQ